MSALARARAVAFPADSALVALSAGADLADAYAIALPDDGPADPELLARCVFGHLGRRARLLLRLRDGIMAPFGVKTTRRLGRDLSAAGTDRIGFFRIRSRGPAEIVLGEDDSHLDFRTAVLLRPAGEGGRREAVAATVVHCHNPLGRAYLAVIAPFHRIIVRSALDRAARAGWRLPGAPAGGHRPS